MKKQPLIILGIILTIVILALALYAYQAAQIPSLTPQIPTTPISKKTIEPKSDINLDKIKKSIQGIKNESFEVVEKGEEECEDETGKFSEYGKDLIEGIATAAEGKVLEIRGNSLIVEFNQASYKWKSEVAVTSATTISTVNSSTQSKPASFSSIVIGDRIVLDSGDKKMTDSKFTTRNIYILK